MNTPKEGSTIRHIESGGEYFVRRRMKAKLNDQWIGGVSYQSIVDGSMYWRSYGDFEGFEEVVDG